MSAISTLVTEKHFEYLAERTSPQDPFLDDLKAAAIAYGIPPIWVAPEQVSLMQILLKLNAAKNVIEVGTLAGYSAIGMARALPVEGTLHSIELLDKHADFAETWIAKSDVAATIQIHRGRGVDILPSFETDSADAAFLDADKSSYPQYVDECLRIVRKGGLIMVDNAFAFGQLFDENPVDKEVDAMRAFNDWMAKRANLHGIIVPMGDGLWVSVVE